MSSYLGNIDRNELYAKTFQLIRVRISQTFAIPMKQLPRVLFHGALLAFIIAGFWLLDSLKDPVLANTVGIEYQPIAKIISVFTTLLVVCVYDFLTSLVSKPALFHIVSSFFGMIILILSALLADPDIGLGNHRKSPHRVLGWISYCTIEAYGSLMVAIFWSYTNSIMNLEQAKGAYGLIISIAQIGAIFGSTLATNASDIGISQLYMIGAIMIFMVSLLIKTYHLTFRDYATQSHQDRVRSISEHDTIESVIGNTARQQIPQSGVVTSTVIDVETEDVLHLDGSALQSSKERAAAAGDRNDCTSLVVNQSVTAFGACLSSSYKVFGGFYEGLSLILQHTYMLKLLVVSCLYEVVVTILDYEFKILGARSAAHHIDSEIAQEVRFANLLGHFGQVTNLLSFGVSFFGFSYVVHHLGVSKSLLIFPILLFVAVVLINQVPSLMVLFVFVSIIKALVFSLHDPVKELLYIPTSEPIKFKAKAWIDVFGSRFAKAAGSLITSMSGGNIHTLRNIGEIPSLILAAFIIIVAYSVGKEFEELVRTNSIVGDDRPAHLRGSESAEEAVLKEIKGRRPGDVGYDGYDPQLFDGVFEEEEEEDDWQVDYNKGRGVSGGSRNSRGSSGSGGSGSSNYSHMKTFEFPRMGSNSTLAASGKSDSATERLRQLNQLAEQHHTYELPPLPSKSSGAKSTPPKGQAVESPGSGSGSKKKKASVSVFASSTAGENSPSRIRAQSAQL